MNPRSGRWFAYEWHGIVARDRYQKTGAVFEESALIVRIIDVDDPEALRITIAPLEIVH